MPIPSVTAGSSPPKLAIEALLLEHPDVSAASLVDEEGPDGHSYTVAYVVPNAERMANAKMGIYLADKNKRIAQWRRAFDQVYRFAHGDHAPSFVGWTSSYTNSPLPETEMIEWLDCTVERIMSLKPNRVLEIGCGVGLLLQKLAPKCNVYRGTDLSPVAIERLREFVATKRPLHHVELNEREATNLDDLLVGSLDTVVINSVAQYFPDISYLLAVLEGAARVVSSGGHIFIGDVRHLGLLPMFHSAVQLAKAPPKATAGWLKRKVFLAVEQERELVIDPRFFLDLPPLVPRICSVEILLKRGRAHNELTGYRYDVVLQVGETRSSPVPPDKEWDIDGQSIAEIIARFDREQHHSVAIRGVSNIRLTSDIASMRRLWSADDRDMVEDFKLPLTEDGDCGLDPDNFWKLSETGSYDVRLAWSPHSTEGHFDVLLSASGRPLGSVSLERSTAPILPQCRSRQATDPVEVAFMQHLGLELQQRLSDRIPESRLPRAVLAVRRLPSSASQIYSVAAGQSGSADSLRAADQQSTQSSPP